jgi:8-oxo-dGTP pyrophosphatase MutT (NUDIX family)
MKEPEAAVAIVQAHGPADSVLLIRRAEREDDSWSGHWSFPGGRRDANDRDLLDTALRELEEECGIRLAREHLESSLPNVLARRKVLPYVMVAPFVFHVDRERETSLDDREATDSLWVPLAVLRDPSRHCLRPAPGRPVEMLFPAIELKGVPLWGFTYRLITDWLGLGPKREPIEDAGFEAASAVMEFLLSQGLTVQHGWEDRIVQPGAVVAHVVKTAAVNGVIPVAPVLEHFSNAERHLAAVNCLEVRPEYIRVAGPAYEEYLIHASGPAANGAA